MNEVRFSMQYPGRQWTCISNRMKHLLKNKNNKPLFFDKLRSISSFTHEKTKLLILLYQWNLCYIIRYLTQIVSVILTQKTQLFSNLTFSLKSITIKENGLVFLPQ